MLSVLIPVYNFDVRNLVRQVIEQFQHGQIPFEIILLNDASDQGFEAIFKELKSESCVKFFENSKTVDAQHPEIA